jgi:hypothetical protein
MYRLFKPALHHRVLARPYLLLDPSQGDTVPRERPPATLQEQLFPA